METTPLQIYKKAYDLQYRENNPEKARILYRELLRDYADSDASLYASIQLSKIQSQTPSKGPIDFEKDDAPKRRSSTGWVVVILLILNLLLSAALIVGFTLHVRSVTDRNENISRLIVSVGKLAAGRDEKALEILTELKIALKKDIAPYVISADIYCKHHDYLRARREYEAYDRLYPGNIEVRRGVKTVNKAEDRYMKETRRIQAQQDSIARAVLKKEPEKEPEPEPVRRPIIRRDDISYF